MPCLLLGYADFVTDAMTAALPILARARVDLAVLFGSVARGTAQAESDVDVGIVPSRPMSLRETLDLGVALERALGREVDLVILDGAAALLLVFEAAKGRPLYERTAGAWGDFVTRAMFAHDDARAYLVPALRAQLAAAREAS